MALNEGVHVIPISNSAAKCLMENWVEERAAKPLDEDLPSLYKQKRGHKGIITLKENEKIEVGNDRNGTRTDGWTDRRTELWRVLVSPCG